MNREDVKSIKDSYTTMTTTTGYTLIINPMAWQFTIYIAQSPAIKLLTYKGSRCAYQKNIALDQLTKHLHRDRFLAGMTLLKSDIEA